MTGIILLCIANIQVQILKLEGTMYTLNVERVEYDIRIEKKYGYVLDAHNNILDSYIQLQKKYIAQQKALQ